MARVKAFTGLYWDEAMEDGSVRVVDGRAYYLVMNRRTFYGLERNRSNGEMMLMLDVYGVGFHQLPDDMWA